MSKFFVYGTLLQGMSNHRVIDPESIEKIEPATIEDMDLYIFMRGSFPCMVEGTGTVVGEVITIKKEYSRKARERMDRLEGFRKKGHPDNFYNRELLEVKLEDGTTTKAFVYLFNDSKYEDALGEKIESGDFKQFYQKRKGGRALWKPERY